MVADMMGRFAAANTVSHCVSKASNKKMLDADSILMHLLLKPRLGITCLTEACTCDSRRGQNTIDFLEFFNDLSVVRWRFQEGNHHLPLLEPPPYHCGGVWVPY